MLHPPDSENLLRNLKWILSIVVSIGGGRSRGLKEHGGVIRSHRIPPHVHSNFQFQNRVEGAYPISVFQAGIRAPEPKNPIALVIPTLLVTTWVFALNYTFPDLQGLGELFLCIDNQQIFTVICKHIRCNMLPSRFLHSPPPIV